MQGSMPLRTRTTFLHAIRLVTIAAIAVPLACDGGAVDQCVARLGITVEPGDFFAGDQLTASAAWTPEDDRCPTDFSWSVSRNLEIAGASSGPQVTFRGLEDGFATVSLTAGAGEFATAQSVEVLRTTGDLDITFTGLSDGAEPDVHLTGPGGYERDIDRNEMLRDLEPGEYTWTVNAVTGTDIGHEFAGSEETGSVVVDRATVAAATIGYDRTTAQVDFDAVNVPDDDTGGEAFVVLDNASVAAYMDQAQNGGGYGGKHYTVYAKLVSSVRTYLIRKPHVSIAVEPGSYNWELIPQKRGYGFQPSITTGTLVATLASNFLLSVPWNPTRAILQATLDGVPTGVKVATLLTIGATSTSPVLPFVLSKLPGAYVLEVLTQTYANTVLNRTETYEPVQSTHTFSLVAGQTLALTVIMFLALWVATFLASINVLSDPFGHATFVAFLATILLSARVNRVQTSGPPGTDGVASAVTQTITVSGPAPWVTVTGPLQDDGSFTATGSGTVAGFPDVPVTFTGTVNADGTLSGTLQMGSDTPPTGLPNGAITYTIEGMPTALQPGSDPGIRETPAPAGVSSGR